jgi:hypothetical protein
MRRFTATRTGPSSRGACGVRPLTSGCASTTEYLRYKCAAAPLPQHHSTGAIDPELSRIRDFMDPRAFCYRNAERTPRMMDLVRLRLNRCDDPLIYARAIRAHLDANNGKLGRQGIIRDHAGQPSLR